MPNEVTPIEIQRAVEQIRQERETFNQRKKQDFLWFVLKLVMGFFSVVLLGAIMIISTTILFNHDQYPCAVVNSAGVALFADIGGLVYTVWKIVLNPKSVTKLEPVTKADEQNGNGSN